MPLAEFRKLQVDLPTDKPVNSRPWQVAGMVFAVVIVGLIVFLYCIETKGFGLQTKHQMLHRANK